MDDSDAVLLEVKPEFMGFQSGEYAGAFPPMVERRIRSLVRSPCLHLFSGSSRIGDVRVDLGHANATVHQDVYQFVQEDQRDWAWAVLDPDYAIERKHIKLTGHARTDSVSGNVLGQRLLEDFLRLHADNVLWFDICSPKPDGFERAGFWAWLPGGYKSVRALTWLRRKADRLTATTDPPSKSASRGETA